jgi:pullulanase/glycogen debranching enzyme
MAKGGPALWLQDELTLRPALGHRFDPEKMLLDPYAKAISSKNYQRSAAAIRGQRGCRRGRSGELLGL